MMDFLSTFCQLRRNFDRHAQLYVVVSLSGTHRCVINLSRTFDEYTSCCPVPLIALHRLWSCSGVALESAGGEHATRHHIVTISFVAEYVRMICLRLDKIHNINNLVI